MLGNDQLATLIDHIYDAALDPGRWPRVIEAVGATFGCGGGVLQQRVHAWDAVGFRETGGFTPEAWAGYRDHYSHRSVWMPSAFQRSGAFVIGHELCDRDRFEKSEFYNDWVRPQGMYDALGGVVERTAEALTVFTVLKPERSGLVTESEKRALTRLMPHFRRSVEIYRRLSAAELQRDGTMRALDGLSIGVVLTDRNARVIFANHVAESVLSQGEGLTLRQGRLRAMRPEDSNRLDGLIEGAVRTSAGKGEAGGGHMVLPTSSGRPLSALVSPCPRLGLLDLGVIVFLSQTREATGLREAARHYKLTRAEAQLLKALVSGERLQDHADAAGVAVSTVRTHLKQLFLKTGTHRQAELVRLFLADPILPSAPSLKKT